MATRMHSPAAQTAPTADSNLTPASMDQAIRLADMMANSNLVPDHLRGQAADCFMVIEQSTRWRMSPFAVAQCTSVVHGQLMYEGKLVLAALHNSGILSNRISFDFEGHEQLLAVTVSGTIRGENEPRTVRVAISEVRTENKMWSKQPQQQLCYSGARVWARRHAPEVMLGVYTPEEFADAGPPPEPGERNVTPAPEQPQALPYYPADKFEQNINTWAQAIKANKATPEKIIAKVRSRGELTEEQERRIRECANDVDQQQE